MSDYLMMGDLTRWEVMWVVKKAGAKPRIVCIEFENDFFEALKLYTRVLNAKKIMPTLRCCNVGFPPPEKYRPRFEVQVVGTRRVKRKGKYVQRRVKQEVEVIPMEELNLKHGVWWCPYCREMRKFQHWDGVKTDGSFFKLLETKDPMFIWQPGMFCPMCGINQNDSHVRRWNPQAVTLEFRFKQRRSSGRRRR